MASFSPLPIHTEGVGAYHINRFRIGLKREEFAPQWLQTLAMSLHDHFPYYVKSDYVPEVELFSSGGRKLIRFVGMASAFGATTKPADVAVPDWVHDDHVWFLHESWREAPPVGSMEEPDRVYGFTVQTLKRETDRLVEVAMRAKTIAENVLIPLSLPSGITMRELIDANKRHFLAGRRSWCIGPAHAFGHVNGQADYILETAAIERFSHPIYLAVNAAGLENFYGDPDGKVTNLWRIMLEQFDAINAGVKLAWLGDRPLRWQSKNEVQYILESYKTAGDLEKSDTFLDTLRLHPWLYPPR